MMQFILQVLCLSGALLLAVVSAAPIASRRQVFVFGDGSFGELGTGDVSNQVYPVPMNSSGALTGRDVLMVAASGHSGIMWDRYGPQHSLVLAGTGQNYGAVITVGNNDVGQLGDGNTRSSLVPVFVDASGVLKFVDIVSISTGGYHSLLLDRGGGVYSFGGNFFGQLGDGTHADRDSPVMCSGCVFYTTKISAGGQHSLVLSSSGQAYGFGLNSYGQLGDGTFIDKARPTPVVQNNELKNGITAISAGGFHSLVISDSGYVFSFGLNEDGQLGIGNTSNLNVPVQVPVSGIMEISAGGAHSLLMTYFGETVYAFGRNNDGQLGDGTFSNHSLPEPVSFKSRSVAISAGGSHSLILSDSGRVYSFGSNEFGQLGIGSYINTNVPVPVYSNGALSGVTVATVSAGQRHSLVSG